jgi:hypothetical protein
LTARPPSVKQYEFNQYIVQKKYNNLINSIGELKKKQQMEEEHD